MLNLQLIVVMVHARTSIEKSEKQYKHPSQQLPVREEPLSVSIEAVTGGVCFQLVFFSEKKSIAKERVTPFVVFSFTIRQTTLCVFFVTVCHFHWVKSSSSNSSSHSTATSPTTSQGTASFWWFTASSF